MQTAIMWIMALGAVLGGADRILGNRFGLGKRFEEGFILLGPTALSMAGILCLSPLLAAVLELAFVPVWNAFHLDPGILGGLLAVDMGGYPLSTALARDADIGRYAGIVLASTLGCTLTFSIPVGMGILSSEDRPIFGRGIVIGLCVLPLGAGLGGFLCGLEAAKLLWHSMPVIVLSLALAGGLLFLPGKTVKGFAVFAKLMHVISTAGLILGAFAYMTGRTILPGMMPVEEAMATVSGIGIVMLGSLPVAELLQRVLRRPLDWLCGKTGMNQASLTGLLIGSVSVVPALTLFSQMDKRGKLINAACLVGTASVLGAHLGYTFGADAAMILPLLGAKFLSGAAGITAALIVSCRKGQCLKV